MLDRPTRRRLVRRARKLARSVFGFESGDSGLCVPLAWAACALGRQQGLQLRMYAGTCYWPRAPGGYRFGYEWEGFTPSNVERLDRGLLPEVHVWAGDPEAQEWIDLSTYEWPRQCTERAGLSWEAPRPPDHLWRSIFDLPAGVVYEPSAEAGQVVLSYIRTMLEDE